MTNVVVKIEKSGNRYNAWDSDGVKYTSQITTGTRKKAFNNGMALEQGVVHHHQTNKFETMFDSRQHTFKTMFETRKPGNTMF